MRVWISPLKQNLQTEIHPIFYQRVDKHLRAGAWVLSTIATEPDPDG